MHRLLTKAAAAAMAVMLFAFPAYANTQVRMPVDIVSATIGNISRHIEVAEARGKAAAQLVVENKNKVEAAEKAEAKKAEEEKKTQVETAAQVAQVPETAAQAAQQVNTAAQSETYAQTEVYEVETQDSYSETYAAETQAPETYAAETVTETQSQTETETKTVTSETGSTSSSSGYTGEVLNATNGMVDGPSGTETYYNLNMSGVVSNARAAGLEGEYWVADNGTKMYGDYIMVAANQDTHPYGSIVETSLGQGIVVDTGDFAASNPNQLDIAVDW